MAYWRTLEGGQRRWPYRSDTHDNVTKRWQNVAHNNEGCIITEEINNLSVSRSKLYLYGCQVLQYAATLRKPGDDYSRVLPHVPADALTGIQSPLVEARIRMAEMRIKLELRSELLGIGITPTDEQLDALLGAIPREDFYRLIAARA